MLFTSGSWRMWISRAARHVLFSVPFWKQLRCSGPESIIKKVHVPHLTGEKNMTILWEENGRNHPQFPDTFQVHRFSRVPQIQGSDHALFARIHAFLRWSIWRLVNSCWCIGTAQRHLTYNWSTYPQPGSLHANSDQLRDLIRKRVTYPNSRVPMRSC